MNREPLIFHMMKRQGNTWFNLDTKIPEIIYIKNMIFIYKF